MTTLCTDDVIGQPGQNLTDPELAILVAMANGNSSPTIAQAIKVDTSTLRLLEMRIRAKLGAKTPSHMVARGFILGVLLPRALCMLIATSCAVATDHNSNRTRSPIRSRAPSSLARITRAGSSNGRSGRTGAHGQSIGSQLSRASAGRIVSSLA